MKSLALYSLVAAVLGTPSIAATTFSNEAQFQNSTQSVIEIDFQTDASGQALSNAIQIDDEYASLGISFSSGPGLPITNFATSDLPTNGQGTYSGQNFIQLVPRSQGGGQLDLSFSSSIRAFSVWLGDIQDAVGTSTVRAQFSDMSTQSFALNPVTGDAPLAFAFFGITFEKDVDKLTFDISPSDYVVFDDVSFGDVAAVPLPSTAWMLLLAIGGFSAVRQRRR